MTTTRRSHLDEALTYAAVGATQAPDVLLFPPKGFTASENRLRIGSGQERFDAAVSTLMSWGVQRASGFTIENVEIPPVAEVEYQGIVFDAAGNPLRPRDRITDQVYADDGTPAIAPGVSAELTLRSFGARITAPVRVISVLEEPQRAGYVYGTLPGHPLVGEESFVVEIDADGGVWFTIRALYRASTFWVRLASPLVAVRRRRAFKRYLRALLPGRG